MWLILLKYALSGLVIVAVTEVAKRSDRLGALIISLPLITIVSMIWIWYEAAAADKVEKVANHAAYTFWYVIPTLPMFLLFPWMIRKGFGFWACMGASLALTAVLLMITHLLLVRFGFKLL